MKRHRSTALPAPGRVRLAVQLLGGMMLVLAPLGLIAGCFGSQTSSAKVPAVKLDFEKYTLANGLDVILRKDSRLPLVAVNLWYHVGPANEAAGRTGFAHLFEHMMFQGSGHIESDSYFAHLEGAGASFVNGTTDFDRTNYSRTCRRTSSSSRCGSRVTAWASCSTASTRACCRTSRTSCATSAARASRTRRTACRRKSSTTSCSRRAIPITRR